MQEHLDDDDDYCYYCYYYFKGEIFFQNTSSKAIIPFQQGVQRGIWKCILPNHL